MPLFVCDRCGCVENTALGSYWGKDMPSLWKAEDYGKALCSECAPQQFKSGEPTRFTGTWHGLFPKKKWDGKVEVINR